MSGLGFPSARKAGREILEHIQEVQGEAEGAGSAQGLSPPPVRAYLEGTGKSQTLGGEGWGQDKRQGLKLQHGKL